MNGKGKRECFLIDAYNVINAWPELAAMRDHLDHARDALVSVLLEYGAFEQYDITVVFDAPLTKQGRAVEAVSKHMRLIYTDEGETADSCIEKLAYTMVREGREVYVVTSDCAEQTVILGAGAYRISSLELKRNIKKAKKRIAEIAAENKRKLSRRELGSRISLEAARRLDELRKRNF